MLQRLAVPFKITAKHIKGRFTRIVYDADTARDNLDWPQAAQLYEKAVALQPNRKDIYVQVGNMKKEAGDFNDAFSWYRRALGNSDIDADVYLQLAHLFKITGNIEAARTCYIRSADLGDTRAAAELSALANLYNGNPTALLEILIHPSNQNEKIVDALARSLIVQIIHVSNKGNFDNLTQFMENLDPSIRETSEAIILKRLVDLCIRLRTAPINEMNDISGPQSESAAIHHLIASLDDVVVPNDTIQMEGITFPQPDDFGLLDENQAPIEIAKVDRFTEIIEKVHEYIVINKILPSALAEEFITFLNTPKRQCVVLNQGNSLVLIRLHLARLSILLLDQLRQEFKSLEYGAWKPEHVYAAAQATRSLIVNLRPLAYSSAPIDYNRLHWTFEVHPDFDFSANKIRAVADVVFATLLRRKVKADSTQNEIAALINGQTPKVVQAVLDEWIAIGARTEDELRFYGTQLRETGHWTGSLAIFRMLAKRSNGHHIGTLTDLAITEKTCGNFALAIEYFRAIYKAEPRNDSVLREYARLLPEVLEKPMIAKALKDLAPLEHFRTILDEQQISDLLDVHNVNNITPNTSPLIDIAAASLTPLRNTINNVSPIEEGIQFLQVGNGETVTVHGIFPRCTGITAVRTRVWSANPIVACRLRLGGKTVARVEAHKAEHGQDSSGRPLKGYLFNIWFNPAKFSSFGVQPLELYFEEFSSGYRSHKLKVYVEPEIEPHTTDVDFEREISNTPTIVEQATRSAFTGPYKEIVFVRVDQLGDAVSSVAAIIRLRELFPQAHLTGIVSRFNTAFFRSTGIIDELVEIDFPFCEITRKRTLDTIEQTRLRSLFVKRAVDIAIDLNPGSESRPILLLLQARYTVGFLPNTHPWLNLGLELHVRIPTEPTQAMPQECLVLSLAEMLSIAVTKRTPSRPAEREKRKPTLDALGLVPKQYVTLHSGSRLKAKRWPLSSYLTLAERLINERGLTIVFFADEEDQPVVQVLASRLGAHFCLATLSDFDSFDEVISNSAVFVGNDTGPKHLATYRGVYTVSLHLGSVPWREWGQNGSGVIMTRSLPCTRCSIELSKDCGRNVQCLVEITPDEVIKEIYTGLDKNSSHSDTIAMSSA